MNSVWKNLCSSTLVHTGTQKEPAPDSEQTNSVVEEMVDIAKPLADGNDAQELLGAHRFTRS